MLNKQLLGLQNKAISIGESSIEDFSELWTIFYNTSNEERINNYAVFAKTFWIICMLFKEDGSGICVNKLVDFIDYMNACSQKPSDSFYNDKETLFITFLHNLNHRDERYLGNTNYDFMDFYNKLCDVVDKVKWLFSLEDDQQKKLFPIRSLIEDVANSFEFDREHYIQLVYSLEIFNIANLDEDKDAIKSKMLSIADEYNIELIKLLCDGGRVCFARNASVNTIYNGTIIVNTGKQILIRNESLDYFCIDENVLDIYKGREGQEGRKGEEPRAYYYIYDIFANERLMDLREVLEDGSNSCRIKVLNYIFSSENANLFLGKYFWIDNDTNDFARVINPFGVNDENTVSPSGRIDDEKNKYKRIISTLINEYNEYGAISLKKRGKFDVLTLDFVLAYFYELVGIGKDNLDRMIKAAETNDDFLQNILIRIFFEDALLDGTVFEAIDKYCIFLEKYYPFEEISFNTAFRNYNRIIMPYRPYVPFDGSVNDFCDLLFELAYIPNAVVKYLNIHKQGRTRKKYLIDDCEIIPDNIVNISLIHIEEKDIIEGTCLYIPDMNKVVLINTKSNNIDIKLEKIKRISEKGILDNTSQGLYREIELIIQIIQNVGFSDYKKNFGRSFWKSNKSDKNISIYKLLWHIQFWELKGERYETFENLLLKKYYTEFVSNPDIYVRRFFDELSQDNDGRLIIAKESDGEGATLRDFFGWYDDGTRGELRKAFDGIQIKENYEMKDNMHYYHHKEIKSIVFITDNMLSGKSTVDMLEFYILNKRKDTEKRTYLWETSEIVPAIIKSNPNIRIEVRSILSTDRAEKRIKSRFSNCNIEIFSKIKLKDSEYNWTREVDNMVVELYETEAHLDIDERRQCIFRPNNMTADTVLPEFVKDISLLTGLFQRKAEY